MEICYQISLHSLDTGNSFLSHPSDSAKALDNNPYPSLIRRPQVHLHCLDKRDLCQQSIDFFLKEFPHKLRSGKNFLNHLWPPVDEINYVLDVVM